MTTTQLSDSHLAETGSGLFDYVSATRLSSWLACPLKFRFRYVDGIEELPNLSLFLGRRVHAGLKYFYRNLMDGSAPRRADVSQYVRATWDETVSAAGSSFDTIEDESNLQRQAIGLVEVYLNQRDPDEGTPLLVEAPLRAPLIDEQSDCDLDTPLFGFVDLVLESPEGFVIVDFKTAARSSSPLDIAHEVQLTIYSYLLRNAFGQRERELQIRSLIKTKQPKIETYRHPPRSDLHFRRLFAVIAAYLDDLRADRFVYRPGWTCSMC